VSCYCGGRKSTSDECWSLSEVSTNGKERNHSIAKGFIFFYMVGKLKLQRFNSWSMGASAALCEVHGIPTNQVEDEG